MQNSVQDHLSVRFQQIYQILWRRKLIFCLEKIRTFWHKYVMLFQCEINGLYNNFIAFIVQTLLDATDFGKLYGLHYNLIQVQVKIGSTEKCFDLRTSSIERMMKLLLKMITQKPKHRYPPASIIAAKIITPRHFVESMEIVKTFLTQYAKAYQDLGTVQQIRYVYSICMLVIMVSAYLIYYLLIYSLSIERLSMKWCVIGLECARIVLLGNWCGFERCMQKSGITISSASSSNHQEKM